MAFRGKSSATERGQGWFVRQTWHGPNPTLAANRILDTYLPMVAKCRTGLATYTVSIGSLSVPFTYSPRPDCSGRRPVADT